MTVTYDRTKLGWIVFGIDHQSQMGILWDVVGGFGELWVPYVANREFPASAR